MEGTQKLYHLGDNITRDLLGSGMLKILEGASLS